MLTRRSGVIPSPCRPPERFSIVGTSVERSFYASSMTDAGDELRRLSSYAVHATRRGRVFAQFGPTDALVRCASVRKSLMNGLIGVAVGRGLLTLDATLAGLDIDDVDPLSPTERQATLRDLLMARSGVYHPSAFQTYPHPLLPPRHRYAPGEHWAYNNWDFNVLATILEAAAGLSVFDAFAKWFAGPLGMQDFDPSACDHRFDPRSRHPAYKFKMSVRDLARYGELFLMGGRWDSTHILPESWVVASTAPLSETSPPFDQFGSYGYLWWAGRPGDLGGRPWFAALGGTAQAVVVVPDADVVIAHSNRERVLADGTTQTGDVPAWRDVLPVIRRLVESSAAS